MPDARTVLLLALLALPVTAREARPSPGCFDARGVVEVVQAGDATLGVRLADNSRYRVELGAACRGIMGSPGATLVSPGGWVCGRAGEAVRAGSRSCPVTGTSPIDARAFSELARQARDAGGLRVLGAVEVTGQRRRGFTGSPAYCLNAAELRGWHEDGDGLVVQVGPRYSRGHRFYRVELSGGCQSLASSAHLVLVSKFGTSLICGFPGDRAVLRSEVAASGYENEFTRPASERGLATANGCQVSLVYPIESPARRPR